MVTNRCNSKKRPKAIEAFVASIGLVGGLSNLAYAAGLEFRTYQTHSHITIPAELARKYGVEMMGNKGLRIVANGDASIGTIPSPTFTDERTKAVVLRDGAVEVLLSDAAQTRGIDYFDYRTSKTGNVSIDYWFKTVASENIAPTKVAKTNSKVSKKVFPKKADVKKTATLAECSNKIDLTKDGHVYWNIYHRQFEYDRYFNLGTADISYQYPYAETDARRDRQFSSRELAHYRLALKLNKESKLALLLRTIAFFEENFPKSVLKKELDFLRASTFVRLAKMLNSEKYYDHALEQYRRIYFEEATSERGRRALAYLVQMHMNAGNHIQALEYALIGADRANAENALSGKASEDLTPWVYRLATAETLFFVGEYDRAERSYQLIMDADISVSPEAAFRIGEVYSARNFWERAILSFEKAHTKYPKLIRKYPTTLFNLAEAYFRIGKIDAAKRHYQKFVETFPNDYAAWAAEYRLAEIQQIQMKDGDVAEAKKIKAQYERVVNRHPYTPGSEFAQLRLAECVRKFSNEDPRRDFYLAVFKERNLKVYEDKLVNAVETEHWFNLAQARFGLANEEYELALTSADSYRGKFNAITLGPSFAKVFSETVVAAGQVFVKKKEFSKLLEIDARYGDLVAEPKPVSYSLAVASANFGAGKMEVARQQTAVLSSRLNEMNVPLRDAYYALSAKQEWLLSHSPEKTGEFLREISDAGDYGAFKYQYLAQAYAAADRWSDAAAAVSRLEGAGLKRKLSIGEQMELETIRLEALANLNDHNKVVSVANDFELRYGVYTEHEKQISRARDLRATSLYEIKDYAAAVRAFSEILSGNEKHPRRAEFEFKRARSLASIGREDEAKEGFRKLAQGPESENEDLGIWRKSAQTELDQLQWENDIKNQIKDRRSLQ